MLWSSRAFHTFPLEGFDQPLVVYWPPVGRQSGSDPGVQKFPFSSTLTMAPLATGNAFRIEVAMELGAAARLSLEGTMAWVEGWGRTKRVPS